MFGSELRYLQTKVGRIHDILTHSCHLVAEYHGIFPSFFRNETVKHHGTDCLLGTYDGISVFLESADGIHSVIDMLPCHAVLCPKG